MWRALLVAPAFAAALAAAAPAEACPDCAAGRRARSEVFREGFGANLLVALLPFLTIGAICVRVEAIGRPRASGRPGPPEEPRAAPPTIPDA